MISTFDPDDVAPEYAPPKDEPRRPADPVIQKRNRGNKQRGKRTERLWAQMLGPDAEVRGILGGADVTWGLFAFECKHRLNAWPSNTTIRKALEQAAKNAGNRTPVVVASMTTHNSRAWRVYSAVGEYVDGKDWIKERTA